MRVRLRWVHKAKRWHLNVANGYGGNRIQNITQTLELFKAAEENYRDDAAVESFVSWYTRAPNECPAIQKQ